MIACWGIQLLGAINELLAGGILGIISSGFYSLIFILFLAFMFYLAWHCVKNALAIHRGEEPAPILFFDQLPIIKEKTA